MDHTPRSRGLGRRALLQAAVGTPAAVAASSLALGNTAAEATESAHPADPSAARFTLAVMPDTQYLFDEGGTDPEPVRESLRYLLRRRQDDNIVFMTHLGDVTEHGTEAEMASADPVFRTIEGKLPWSVLAGNHDVSGDDQRGDTPFLRTFGPRRFARSSTFRGASPDGYNTYHVFRAADRTWLVLALDWRTSDEGLAWARQVLDQNPGVPTILTTHDIVSPNDDGSATISDNGRHLWDGLIRSYDQIFLAMGGHYWPAGRTVQTNEHGNPVHLHITNYQDRYYGGAGMIRYYTFDLATGAIDVETFSPWLLEKRNPSTLEAETRELSGDVDRFTVELDFHHRFPGTPIPPLPPNAVLLPGTVAYWRFDGKDGDAATAARDLSGQGNDLTVQRIGTSGPDVLKYSAEFHEAQPAHGSVRFDGAKNRGAVLHTSASAPLATMKFQNGYTLETFIKLPEPFEGDHAWMGIFSWEGRAGDAGKDGGWSPDDAPCSLNVTSERFLQFVVYPVNQNDDPTCWSHALPPGRWTHVAVVNDGHHTAIYVDGSKIARNASLDSNGISTVGKPFAIGGTQGGGRYDQGFYGWIGDTRIVSRALRPDQFLTAR
ncbi:LamG-like jellyroll fold domain-containing protein [Amycolatopsis pithecellobii]|uniref:Tat pathway signal sequence domain protein n=1 Tax=Amycolatopsis pithecellobii TaxID=664692 RepID=A0A6N7ZAF8_9PSEU|nr:LamG-like jellyroll fold domain-containing protein [Amycolatopsis pithecellobii]MTD58728.1 Tat pathway signal sequence domain protein [Amycolatopsis pithecellobii]